VAASLVPAYHLSHPIITRSLHLMPLLQNARSQYDAACVMCFAFNIFIFTFRSSLIALR